MQGVESDDALPQCADVAVLEQLLQLCARPLVAVKRVAHGEVALALALLVGVVDDSQVVPEANQGKKGPSADVAGQGEPGGLSKQSGQGTAAS